MNLLISLTGAILLLSGAGSLEELDENEYARYSALAEQPICINLASTARLRSCGLFSSYQVASLQNYIESSGDILSISELGTVPGFTPHVAEALAYFISLESYSRAGERRKRKLRQDAMVRYGGSSLSGKYHLEAGDRAEGWLSCRQRLTLSMAVYGKRPWKLILGDYNARMGQGLLVWGSFSLGGFSSTSAFSRNASGISGTGSWSPSWRGFAAGYDGRRWQASAAVGMDGCLLGAVSFLGSTGSVGANCIYGNAGKGLSLDWKKSFGHLAFFGEAAWCGSPAIVAGCRWDPSYETSAVALARYYPPDYQAAMAGAVRSGSKTKDEAGISAGVRVRWFSATADMAFHPDRWKKHAKNYQQFKSVISAAPQFSAGRWLLSPSARWTERMQLSPKGDAAVPEWKHELRCDLKAARGCLDGTLRLDFLQTGTHKPGGLAYLEAGGRWPGRAGEDSNVPDTSRLQLSLHLRATICRTDGWTSRIYAYERDLPGAFNVPAWYGRMHGLSLVAGVRYRRKKTRHQLDLRAGLTKYAEFKIQYAVRL